MIGRGFQGKDDLMAEFGMTDADVAEMDRRWESARRDRGFHHFDFDLLDPGDPTGEDRCPECGQADVACPGDCLGTN